LAIGREIAEVLERVDAEAFWRVVDAFREPERALVFLGPGAIRPRRPDGGNAVHAFGPPRTFRRGSDGPGGAGADGLALVSGSGETAVSVHFARIAKAEEAGIVLITGEPNSSLGKLADFVLQAPVASTRQFGGSLFEQASLILLDAIVLELSQTVPDAHTRMFRRHTNLQ
jgi:6-phospho-3-hexuloisomerase